MTSTMASWIDPGTEEAADQLRDAAFGTVRGGGEERSGRAPSLDDWFLELIAADVAWLADCEPLRQRHRVRFEAALDDTVHAAQMIEGIETNTFGLAFDRKHAAILRYVDKLATLPQAMSKGDINAMRAAGASDDEILDACLAVAEATRRVRLVRGLGIEPAD